MKAMIFAAGLGTRFKPWTDHHPKALALVNGKSLLQRNVEYLQQYGIYEVVVNVHHFAEQIVAAVHQSEGWGSKILISDETGEVLETGGGLMKARTYLDDSAPFITLNADILTNLNLNALVAYHTHKKSLISFGVTNRKTSRNLLFDPQMKLVGWRNNSTGALRMAIDKYAGNEPDLKEMAYSCAVVFESAVFNLIQQRGKFSLIDVYLDLAASHPVYGYDHTGDLLVDVGKPESIALAASQFI
jgi:NDP-sugar pyrophosphorylase family protein